MGEKIFRYTANIKQPQKVGNKKIIPGEGTIIERDLKALKKDVYGASLIDKGLLVIGEEVKPSSTDANTGTDANKKPDDETNQNENADSTDEIPDFDANKNSEA